MFQPEQGNPARARQAVVQLTVEEEGALATLIRQPILAQARAISKTIMRVLQQTLRLDVLLIPYQALTIATGANLLILTEHAEAAAIAAIPQVRRAAVRLVAQAHPAIHHQAAQAHHQTGEVPTIIAALHHLAPEVAAIVAGAGVRPTLEAATAEAARPTLAVVHHQADAEGR